MTANKTVLLACAVAILACPGVAQQNSNNPFSTPPKNIEVEQSRTIYRFRNDGTGEIVQSARLRALTNIGQKTIGEMYFSYSTEMEDLRIDYLRTVKANGTVIPADPSKAFDLTPPVTRMAPTFSDVKVKALVAPQLQVGDAVEYQTTTTIRTPFMRGQFWASQSVNRLYSVKAETVVLSVPAGRKLSFEADPCYPYITKKKNGRRIYTWTLHDLKPPKYQFSPQPPLFSVSTLSDWKQVGDWYLKLQSDRTQITPQITALAQKLTAGKKTPQAKVDAIYAYVAEKVRYVAIEFGIGGYQAHAAQNVLTSGYGDCKDKSGLLQTLLAAAGIASHPVLVNAVGRSLQPTVPMPIQFDHVMTVVPLAGKTLWVDSTMETADPGVLSPTVLGKRALLVNANASQIVKVPSEEPFPQQFVATATGSVDPAGKLTLNTHLQLHGITEALLRLIFEHKGGDLASKVLNVMAKAAVPGALVAHSGNSDPENLSQPFSVHYELTKEGFLDLLQKNEEIVLPHYFIAPNQWGKTLETARLEEREEAKSSGPAGCAPSLPNQIKLGGPAEYQETLDLIIPAGYQVELPEPIQVTRPFATYSSTYSFKNGRLEAQRDLTVKSFEIPMDARLSLSNFQSLIDADLRQELTLRRAASANILSSASSMTSRELVSAANEALAKHHDPMLSRDLLLKAVAKDPKSQVAWNDLGRAYASMRNFYDAKRAYRKQLDVNPYDEYAHTNLGLLDMARYHYDAAIAEFKQQLEVNPLDGNAVSLLASAYDQKRDWANAATAYSRAVRIQRGNALLYAAWGTDLLRLGKTEDGRAEMKRALQLSKAPVVLNNTAYGLAQAGVDLTEAEQDARSALNQAIPENADSLNVPKTYTAQFVPFAAYLDTLGWILYKEGKTAEAQADFKAALEISRDPSMAKHYAVVAMKLGQPELARRFYLYSQLKVYGSPAYIPKNLNAYLQNHGGLPSITPAHTAEAFKQLLLQRRILPPPGFSYTEAPATLRAPAFVAMNVFVDDTGNVQDAAVASVSSLPKGMDTAAAALSAAALKDVRKLHFPPLVWPGHSLNTVRMVFLLYNPNALAAANRQMVFWRFGLVPKPAESPLGPELPVVLALGVARYFCAEGQTSAGIQLIKQAVAASKNSTRDYASILFGGIGFEKAGAFAAAKAVFQLAQSIQPKDDFADRELAETLTLSGDRAGAMQAYQDLLQLEPDDAAAHFALGLDYEAQAAAGLAPPPSTELKKSRHSNRHRAGKKQIRAEYQSALSQYSLAMNLQPKNSAYSLAYSKLYEKVYRHPPPAASTPARALQ
jgi:tetratricopeptide (TPR) repeat protein